MAASGSSADPTLNAIFNPSRKLRTLPKTLERKAKRAGRKRLERSSRKKNRRR